MVLQRNRRIHSGNGFFGSFDAPWSEWSWIDLFIKETQNPFSDSFGLKNPILDFLKETHPTVYTDAVSFITASVSMRLQLPFTLRRFEFVIRAGSFLKRFQKWSVFKTIRFKWWCKRRNPIDLKRSGAKLAGSRSVVCDAVSRLWPRFDWKPRPCKRSLNSRLWFLFLDAWPDEQFIQAQRDTGATWR